MKDLEIYYFSGTGNSLHIARELKKRIPNTTLIPIISALDLPSIETKAEIIGFVFPIQAFTFPHIVKKFLQRVDVSTSSYIFAITSRICSSKVFSDMNKLLAKKNKFLNASFSVEMPINYIPMFKIPSEQEIEEIEHNLQEKLDTIQEIIINKKVQMQKDPISLFLVFHLIFPLITWIYQRTSFFNVEKTFYSDSKCKGCGTCERVCLSGKIRINNDKPEWKENIKCTYCYACIHYCPVQAIQIRKGKTTKNKRYHHAEINAVDIAGQKNWGE